MMENGITRSPRRESKERSRRGVTFKDKVLSTLSSSNRRLAFSCLVYVAKNIEKTYFEKNRFCKNTKTFILLLDKHLLPTLAWAMRSVLLISLVTTSWAFSKDRLTNYASSGYCSQTTKKSDSKEKTFQILPSYLPLQPINETKQGRWMFWKTLATL